MAQWPLNTLLVENFVLQLFESAATRNMNQLRYHPAVKQTNAKDSRLIRSASRSHAPLNFAFKVIA